MNTKENKDEIRAKKYLQTLNFTNIEYEPLGNVTPDFLLDKKIAVEVRRINRNHIDENNFISVENVEMALIKKIKHLINTFKCNFHINSAYISITLSKSFTMQSKKTILRKIKRILSIQMKSIAQAKNYSIANVLDITFTPIQKQLNAYTYVGCNGDSFWLLHQLHKKMQSVIDEKNKKIEKNFNLYSEWWLILVDSIIYGLDEEDFIDLQKLHLDKRRFTKVIIISPKGEFETFEF